MAKTENARVCQDLLANLQGRGLRTASGGSVRQAGTGRRSTARRQALPAFGGVEKHKEALRDGRELAWLGRFNQKVFFGRNWTQDPRGR